MIALILAVTLLHCCVRGNWSCEEWETDMVLWTITWKAAENINNFVACQVIRGCVGRSTWFPHPSNPTLGLREDMNLFSWGQQETHFSMIQSFFLWSCHNIERKLISCLTPEWAYYNLRNSTSLLSTSSHPFCIVIIPDRSTRYALLSEGQKQGLHKFSSYQDFFLITYEQSLRLWRNLKMTPRTSIFKPRYI